MEVIRQGTVEVVTIVEPMVGEFVEELSQKFAELGQQGVPRVVLNMQQVPLVDGAALETLLDKREEFERRGGSLQLVAPTDLCREILEVTDLTGQFDIHPDNKTAVGSFAR